ncbi:MAG: DNA gyrase inhibitor YacG [Acidobacteriaceae bacterium]|nr:DNA gyrase inhibitor YacG [Acidobacteriaceae bacterium]
MTKAIFCPICKNTVLVENENFPFCSDRCRLLDLGKWASGDYKISSPVLDPELLEEVEQAQLNAERRSENDKWKN